MPRAAHHRALALVALLGCGGTSVAASPDAAAPGGDDASGDGSAIIDAPTSPTDSPTDSPVDAGAPGTNCSTGTVTFELRLAPGAGGTTYCLGPPTSCTGAAWLSIRPASGGDALSLDTGCVADCNDCQPVACSDICATPLALGDGGANSSWDGTYYTRSTCGAALDCVSDECAPAGNYIASLCGFPEAADASPTGGECNGATPPTCVDVPFAWPPPSGSAVVVGELGGPTGDAAASDSGIRVRLVPFAGSPAGTSVVTRSPESARRRRR